MSVFLTKPFWIIKDIAIISLEVIGSAFGISASIHSIINYFKHPPNDRHLFSKLKFCFYKSKGIYFTPNIVLLSVNTQYR